MKMTFKQTIIKGVFDEENIVEYIYSNIAPNIGDYVRVGKIEGRVFDKSIDYDCKSIIVRVKPMEMF